MPKATDTKIKALLAPGQRIFVQGSCNEPTGVLAALQETELPDGLQFMQFPIAGYNSTDFTSWNATAQLTTFFMAPHLRQADPARLHFLPMQMRWIYDYIGANTDVALVQVAKDSQGVVRFGPNVDFTASAMASAKVVIAELNHALVAPLGAPKVELSSFDLVIESERLPPYPAAMEVDAVATTIGRSVADLVPDGACLQTGIGAIPAAILAALTNKNDLGWHGGLVDDGVLALIRNGNITGARKPVDTGLHITGMALGSLALHTALAERDDVKFVGANVTHEVSAMAQQDNFVSVNSAVEVDLYGQVNAEVAGGRQISGTGGSVDFMRGAKASRAGRSVVAMNATARGGSLSRIVPKAELVTALRTDVDTVVTEFGVAELKDKPLHARAEALIAIAAPEFRDTLREQVPR